MVGFVDSLRKFFGLKKRPTTGPYLEPYPVQNQMKLKNVPYSQEQKDLAVQRLRNGMTLRQAAKLVSDTCSTATVNHWLREAERKELRASILADRRNLNVPAARP